MKYKKEIELLRKEIPISLTKALILLEEKNGNIDIVKQQFKKESIQKIIESTNCSFETAEKFYLDNKLDIAKAIAAIIEWKFDQNYRKPRNLVKKELEVVYEWLKYENWEDFISALAHEKFQIVTKVVKKIGLSELEINLQEAKKRQDSFLNGKYRDIDEFINLKNELKSDSLFKKNHLFFEENKPLLEKVLAQHFRNID